jgi:hypothetical protein
VARPENPTKQPLAVLAFARLASQSSQLCLPKDTFSLDCSTLNIAGRNARSDILLHAIPDGGNHIDQENPIWEHQELAQQHKPKCDINGIAAKSKDTRRYKSVRAVWINANAETPPKRNEAQEQ